MGAWYRCISYLCSNNNHNHMTMRLRKQKMTTEYRNNKNCTKTGIHLIFGAYVKETILI